MPGGVGFLASILGRYEELGGLTAEVGEIRTTTMGFSELPAQEGGGYTIDYYEELRAFQKWRAKGMADQNYYYLFYHLLPL